MTGEPPSTTGHRTTTRGMPVHEAAIRFPPVAREYHESCFPRIKQALNLDFARDHDARDKVQRVLAAGPAAWRASPPVKAGAVDGISNGSCCIVAPGPSLEDTFPDVVERLDEKRNIKRIAVDGAGHIFMETNAPADIIVTDLDGLDIDQILHFHDENGALIIVHCHGNNVERLERLLEEVPLDGRYVFTTQVEPTRDVYNWGGFTDGDRAVFASLVLGFTTIQLVSMDLDAPEIGRYSKMGSHHQGTASPRAANPVKDKKLGIALKTLQWLAARLPAGTRMFTVEKRNALDFIPDRQARELN